MLILLTVFLTWYLLVEFNRFPELSSTSAIFPGLSSPGKCHNKRVLENLESPGILLWHFPGWKVLENAIIKFQDFPGFPEPVRTLCISVCGIKKV